MDTPLQHVIALIGAVVVAFMLGWTGHEEFNPPERHGCTSFDAETLTDSEVRGLLHAGWFGDPTDGEERVYSPDCEVQQR